MKKLGIIMALVLSLGVLWWNPFKVTNPDDPKFDPMKFRFADYQTNDEVYHALEIMLKPGTDMKTVDKILINSAGAKKTKVGPPDDRTSFKYHYKRWYHPLLALRAMHPDPGKGARVYVFYDENNKVEKFKLN